MSNPNFTKAGTVSPFIENKNYQDFNEKSTLPKRKISKIESDENMSPPNNRSVRFYASNAYVDSQFKKPSVLDSEEKLLPVDRGDKELQNHFVSLCDKNSQFLYSNSNLSRQALKYYLQKRYCKNVVEKLLNFMNFPQTASFNIF